MILNMESYIDMKPERLDIFLVKAFPELSRSNIQNLIRDGAVKVNGNTVKTGYLLSPKDQIFFPDERPVNDIAAPEAKDIPLDIVYEDEDLIVIDKPKGLVIHPAPGHTDDTLVNALMFHCGSSLSGINGELRPGIVHRIDRDTTGLIVACKNDEAHIFLSEQLEKHSITRRYKALCHGTFREGEGTVDAPIGRSKNDRKKMAVVQGGRHAVTHYRVLESFRDKSLIECRLETGRTHQIRVHMSYIHHPLLGDEVYGYKNDSYKSCGQYLHAYLLGFIHPRTHEYMEFTSELPEYFENTLEKLRGETKDNRPL